MKTLRAVTLIVIFASFAAAQTGVGVSPPRVAINANPGDVVQGVVLVDHPGNDAPMQVDVSLSDVVVQSSGEPVYLDPGSIPQSAAEWISFKPTSFVLSPKSSQEIRYTVHIPADTREGTYWTVMFFDSGPVQEQREKGIGMEVRVRVGHVIYVNVGQITKSGEIRGLRYQPPTGRNPAEIRVRFHNTGNGLMRLNGYVELRNKNGKTIARAKINNVASLPGYEYEIPAPIKKELPGGDYLVLVMIDYGGDEAIVGEGKVRVP